MPSTRRTSRPLLRVGLPVLMAGGIGFATLVAFSNLDRWLVREIRFEGLNRATVGELRHLADVPNGTPTWRVYLPGVEERVATHPWVRTAHAERLWPYTVRVVVEEHTPVALLHEHGSPWYVDADGIPFLRASSADLDYPHLTGFDVLAFDGGSTAPAHPGRSGYRHPRLQAVALRAALDLVDRLDRGSLVPRREISEISFRPTTGFTIYTGTSRLLFAPERFDEQISRLTRLVETGLDLSLPQEIDLAPASVAIVRPLSPLSAADGG